MDIPARNAIADALLRDPLKKGDKQRKAPAEIAFGALRLLLAERLFWGVGARLTVTCLGELIGASPGDVARALAGLDGEGLVRLDLARDRVDLTDLGAQQLS